MANLQTLSPEGAKFIQNFEGFKPKPYRDSGGLWTIGFGQRITDEEVAAFKDGITREEASAMFDTWISSLVVRLRKCPLALLQYQFDAVCSLAYNIGLTAFLESTIYKQLTVRGVDLSGWLAFIKDARGHVDDGLVQRRRLEMKLFIY